ncbi:DUF6359 domain-containing protein, partial [Saccharothrix sp. MB29]|nr:DUF6359 domain-containing protein [Saccharothrix sp. MB29]
MLYVQITSSFRAQWGLRSNPSLLGRQVDVTGPLGAYFSHAGLTSPTAFAFAGTSPTTTTTTVWPTTTTSAPGGGYDDTYYRTAIGKSGTALKTALNGIVRTQTKLSYDQVWEALKVTDQDPANSANVILLYSGRSQAKTTNGGDANDWNRE